MTLRQAIACALLAAAMGAQASHKPGKFDPRRFEAALEQYITTEAALTPSEAAAFFKLYREMKGKQRVLFRQMMETRHTDLSDEKACREAVRRHDELDMEMKRLQSEYHGRFIDALSGAKVVRIMNAEERFHRQELKKAAGRAGKRGGK